MSVLDTIINPRLAADGLRPEDGIDDMTHISSIDVDGINTNLRVRFNRDEIYTYSGTILVAVNPYKTLPIYERDMIDKYVGSGFGDQKPHVFATAEAAFRNVQTSDTNQSCLISGESGAGKTETTKFILQYLCAVSTASSAEGSTWVQRVEQQILQSNIILEAFGNAKTVRNDNSSRFGKFIQVCFDDNCEIRGSIIQEYLLEQSRIVSVAPDERNYHVFYQLLAGGDEEEFLLEPKESYYYLNQSSCYTLNDISDANMYEELRLSMSVLNIEAEFIDGIFAIVSAVLHIGNFVFKDLDGDAMALTDKDRQTTKKVAKLLGISDKHVEEVVTQRSIVVRGSTTTIPFKYTEAIENKHAMAKALYSRTFTWLVDKINSTTNPGSFTSKFIGVLDIFGFENFADNSFEQLCINFTNEKLHKFFNHYVFDLEQAEYEKEGIEFAHIQFTDNTECLELIEKPPKCVLRLLDEECRFPKGTDTTYLEKQHKALSGHPHYLKGEDKTKWDKEFGIRHFAGDVVYSIDGFLGKNKDVVQDTLFNHMHESTKPFIKDVTRFQNLLTIERKVIFGKKLHRNESVMRKGSNRDSMRTNKSKPTVGDTFRRQLGTLVEVLLSTTPWYVRCIKPNAEKKARKYTNDLVITQLNYSGMLDIVRIRKQGYPVHVPAEKFVDTYFAMARVMGKELNKDPRVAVGQIMEYIHAPKTEWQIGKTKVFLRNSVFEPLQQKLQLLIKSRVLCIQKVMRGAFARRDFQRMRAAVIKLQAAFKGARLRLAFVRKRRAAITIQAYTRGFFAREVVKEIKRKRKEEEERLRREREEAERRRLQEEGEAQMEESVEQASRELREMLLQAQAQVSVSKSTGGKGPLTANLDSLFSTNTKTLPRKSAKAYLKNMNSEMDSLLAGKPSSNAKDGKGSGAPQQQQQQQQQQQTQAAVVTKKPGARTIRRRERAQKRIDANATLTEAEVPEASKQAAFNPKDFPMVQYAKTYFADHPKGGSGTLGRSKSLRRGQKVVEDPVPKEEMVVYSKQTTLATSLVKLHNPENVNIACSIWKDLNKQLRGELKEPSVNQSVQSIVAYCLEREELRDEMYCQVIKQVSNNPSLEQQSRGWELLAILSACFSPTKALYRYVRAFMMNSTADSVVGKFAAWALDALKRTKLHDHQRRSPPSQIEMKAVRSLQPIYCRFFFLDNNSKAIGVHPCSTSLEVVKQVAEKIGLQNAAGWALFESTPQAEHFVKGNEFVADVLSDWEKAHMTSMQMSKYSTTSRKKKKKDAPDITKAVGGGEAKFVFRKRLFLHPQDEPKDPIEFALMYHQAVHSVVKVDEYPVTEKVALQLAGLQAQVLYGPFKEDAIQSRYHEIPNFISERIRSEAKERTVAEWQGALASAHRDFGRAMSCDRARVLYLAAVRQFPLYGGTFFPVQYKSHWSFPAQIFLTIHNDCFKFVSLKSKEVLAPFPYTLLKTIEVNVEEDTIILHLTKPSPIDQQSIEFYTPRAEDIANLIASYSRQHRNWKTITTTGAPTAHVRHVSKDEKERVFHMVLQARQKLAADGLLLQPSEGGRGILANTLRRKKSDPSKSPAELAFEKSYPEKYWAYSKNKLSQPLSNVNPENQDASMMLFNSLLIYSGLASGGGVPLDYASVGLDPAHPPVDHDHVLMIQTVLQLCLEHEDLCNEFYLQLIKQTTDQPDAKSSINLQHWRFFALSLGVVVPRVQALRVYIQMHLRRYALNQSTEEGQFAQFCLQCFARTLRNNIRKYPPSRQEIMCITRMRPIHARFHFMDGQYRALMFDASATTQEVMALIKERVGLDKRTSGFSLFEIFGSLERHMLPWEKVADAIYKWEKYALSTNSRHELKITFKKRLFLRPFTVPEHPVEFDLVFNQAMSDVRDDRFPVTAKEAAFLVALRAQVELGQRDAQEPVGELYADVITKYLPKHLHDAIKPKDVAEQHAKLAKKSEKQCNETFLKFVQAWPLYGATIFEVMQAYTKNLPKMLWLAVDEKGFHLLKRRSKEPLISYGYKSIGSYSPSLRNLMIVTGSLTRGTKFMFNTTQASQIAHLMKDYTAVILQRRKAQQDAKGAPAKASK